MITIENKIDPGKTQLDSAVLKIKFLMNPSICLCGLWRLRPRVDPYLDEVIDIHHLDNQLVTINKIDKIIMVCMENVCDKINLVFMLSNASCG